MRIYKLILLLTIVLCSNLSVLSQQITNPSDAEKVINMTNSVIDIYNNQVSQLKYVNDCLDRFEKSIEIVSKNPNLSTRASGAPATRGLLKSLLDKMHEKAKIAPSFTEKAEILSNIEIVNKEFASVSEYCDKLKAYFNSKEYLKDDENFSKYDELMTATLNSYSKVQKGFEQALTSAEIAGNKAEIILLKGHPLAAVFIPMKTNLTSLRQLMSKCRSDNPDASVIKNEVSILRKSLERDRTMTSAIESALQKTDNGKIYFDRFYENMDKVLKSTDVFTEYLNPNKVKNEIDHVLKESEEDAQQRLLSRYYREISKFYENMVESYNSL